MKVAAGILAVSLAFVGALYYKSEKDRTHENQQSTDALAASEARLVSASNQFAAIELQESMVRTQMIQQVAQLKESVTTLGTEKTQAEDRTKELRRRLEEVEKDLADEKAKLSTVDAQRTKVVNQLNTVNSQLTNTQQQVADAEKVQRGTNSELEALRVKIMGLEQERDSLNRQLNDLETLQTQIKLVKHRLWEEHVAEWKRRDAEATINGNGGMLLKGGSWQASGSKPAL